MSYPSLEHVDDAWLERTLASAAMSPSPYLSSWPIFDTPTKYTATRPTTNSSFYYGPKFQSVPESTVVPPVLPSSAFIDASSPDAWAPRKVVKAASVPVPVPVAQPATVVAAQVSAEDLASNSVSSSPAKLRPDVEAEINKQNLYKTELCRNWLETGQCRYGTRCQFAHGEHEMRGVLRHPKYKTEICRTFHTTGTCSYGKRCRFVHHPNEMRVDGQDLVTNQQIGLLKQGGSIIVTPLVTQSQSLGVPRSDRSDSFSSSEVSALMSPSRSANTSPSSPPPSPVKVSPAKMSAPESVQETPKAVDIPILPVSSSVIAEEPAEDFQDEQTKKNSYRLPFFARLHSWKKK